MGTKVDDNLPINLGFAGFRLCFPVNAPHVWDEVVAFLGASYFRFLGRGQRYGLSARGLAVGGGLRLNEEFPYFREFWIETPDPAAERIVICALLDGQIGDRRLPLRPRAGTANLHRDQRDALRPQGRSGAWGSASSSPRCTSSAKHRDAKRGEEGLRLRPLHLVVGAARSSAVCRRTTRLTTTSSSPGRRRTGSSPASR